MTFLNKHKSVAQFENGIRTGLSNASYSEQFDRPAFTDQQKAKESELPQPTNNDAGFEESEAWFMPPSGIDWGFDSPIFDYGVPNPSSPWNIIFQAWTNDCFVKGEATPIEIRGTYPIVDASVHVVLGATLSGSGNNYTIFVPESGSGIVSVFTTQVTPDGVEGHPNAIVFECSDTCDCDSITPAITYDSQQMGVSGAQDLGISGGGLLDSDCFTWSLSGGGSLSDSVGTTITYTAPSSNAGCSNNPTITLSCDGGPVDTLEIAVNADGSNDVAFQELNGCVEGYAYSFSKEPECAQIGCISNGYGYSVSVSNSYNRYKCDGTLLDTINCAGSSAGAGCGSIQWNCTNALANAFTNCANNTPAGCGTMGDKRTSTMIANGCCPEQLL